MKKYQLNAKSNPYYRTFPGLGLTQLTNIFDTVSDDNKILPRHLTRGLEDISYFSLLLGYEATPTPTTDLFEFFDDLDLTELRNNKNTILIFDCTFEGMPSQDLRIAQSLEYSCVKNQIDPKKIFVFTGNLKPLEHNTSVNVIPIFVLQNSFENLKSISLTDAYSQCNQFFNQKIVLSLSRRPRQHRVLAHFMLANSEIFNNCIVSQCRSANDIMFGPDISSNILTKMGLTFEDWEHFKESLPFIADGQDFERNDPFNRLPMLHASTLFSIVNETLADNQNETSLFYSEKFLKPIINFQPMLIYGQHNINKKLSILGFKNYETYFNLDFDDEPDDILRYKKLLASATDTVRYLKSLSRDRQIEWRFRQNELLEFNFHNALNMPHVVTQMSVFLGIVRNNL
jgi:hypothetical protein